MSGYPHCALGSSCRRFIPMTKIRSCDMERDFQLIQWLHVHKCAEAWIGEHHSGGCEIYGRPELLIATAAERTWYIRLDTGGNLATLPSELPSTHDLWRIGSCDGARSRGPARVS
jgi:hypothetical protein